MINRGKVVAKLGLLRTSQTHPTAADVLSQLAREEILTLAIRASDAAPDCMSLTTFDELMLGLAADRRDA
jgi:hypothetical protein